MRPLAALAIINFSLITLCHAAQVNVVWGIVISALVPIGLTLAAMISEGPTPELVRRGATMTGLMLTLSLPLALFAEVLLEGLFAGLFVWAFWHQVAGAGGLAYSSIARLSGSLRWAPLVMVVFAILIALVLIIAVPEDLWLRLVLASASLYASAQATETIASHLLETLPPAAIRPYTAPGDDE